MSHDGEQQDRKALEAYLDGRLSPDELRAFEKRLNEPDVRDAVDQQASIDDSLRRLFAPRVPSLTEIERRLAATDVTVERPPVTRPTLGRRQLVLALAIVGIVAWVMVAFQFRGPDRTDPLFVARPLVSIYQEAVAQGFEPYYECREPERFAYTFEQRQGVLIDLDPMPVGSGMLGLSYSGGLSRETTVMLCMMEGRPVMVFVDRIAEDKPSSTIVAGDDGLNVFRDERDGLVMYEVTPFNEAKAMGFLRPRDTAN